MSIHVSIPSLSNPCASMPTTKLTNTASPSSAPSTSGSSSCLVSLPPPAQLRSLFSRASPRRSCNADLGFRVSGTDFGLSLRLRIQAFAQQSIGELRTCRNCKKSFDSSENHPRACRFHTAHFGGETKRKFESVYTGGTLDTDGGGEITQYWHCCGSSDPFDPGCEAAPHSTYDD